MADLPEETNSEVSADTSGESKAWMKSEISAFLTLVLVVLTQIPILVFAGVEGIALVIASGTFVVLNALLLDIRGVRGAKQIANVQSKELATPIRELESTVETRFDSSNQLTKTAEVVQALADNLQRTNLSSFYSFTADGQELVVEVRTKQFQTRITNNEFERTFREQFQSIEPELASLKTIFFKLVNADDPDSNRLDPIPLRAGLPKFGEYLADVRAFDMHNSGKPGPSDNPPLFGNGPTGDGTEFVALGESAPDHTSGLLAFRIQGSHLSV